MMNPFEYRETLWAILYEGEKPTPRKAADPKKVGGQKALPRGSHGMTRQDKVALEKHLESIAQIKARRGTEES